MPKGFAPFDDLEYAARLVRTRKSMAARGIDVLVATDPSNQAWLTGYDGWSFYVHQAVIITQEGPPIWWGRKQDANGARRTVFMEEDYILAYAETYIQASDCHPMEDLAQRLHALSYGGAHIGVEMENYYYSAKAHAVLSQNLPNAKLGDATGLVNWQRAIKSDAEIALMRKAARIMDRIITLALSLAEVGRRKNEIAAEIMRASVLGCDADWGDYPAIVPLMPSGQDASASHLTWNDSPMRAGEVTFFEMSGCYRRYHAPLS
ncbi:MAG: Xaa-Pro peptidase family protein [Pseudomonadota bacterium]